MSVEDERLCFSGVFLFVLLGVWAGYTEVGGTGTLGPSSGLICMSPSPLAQRLSLLQDLPPSRNTVSSAGCSQAQEHRWFVPRARAGRRATLSGVTPASLRGCQHSRCYCAWRSPRRLGRSELIIAGNRAPAATSSVPSGDCSPFFRVLRHCFANLPLWEQKVWT